MGQLGAGLSGPAGMVALAAGTLVSEDVACVAAGLLVRDGRMTFASAATACFFGIVAGDLGLWAAGRLLGRRLLGWPWLSRRLPADRVESASAWLDRNMPQAVVASRFLPGSRLPLFVASGMLGRDGWRFALWATLAALIWTPLVVLASASAGVALPSSAGAAAAGVVAMIWGARWAGGQLASGAARAKLHAAVSRLWRWEFWPSWVLYVPVAVWIGVLMIRYRGVTVFTAANPMIPDGGLVGESKHRILASLPERWTLPAYLIEPGPPWVRAAALARIVEEAGFIYPVILKPDAGQRGEGVRLARDPSQAAELLARVRAPVLVQKYHPGPFEAGIFYYRLPGSPSGRIFSITDKRFPELTGDGVSSLEELIWRHPRYRMQARVFLARLEASRSRVPARGERVRLAEAGNHCQGTMFVDGSRLLTPALERTIDRIAGSAPGFFFGRFDVRYSDVEAFRAGRDLAIVELNGVTAESTNIYDPSCSLPSAWVTLCRQWSILFRIGDANRRRGHKATPLPDLAGKVLAFYRGRTVPALSD